MTAPALPPVLPGLSALADRYDGFILDLWGVLHDGERPYPGVLDCLERLLGAGKRLCLLSNVPQRIEPVVAILERIGIGPDRYHHLVTSGETTFEALQQRADPWHAALGRHCLHLGAAHERPLFDELPEIRLVDHAEAAEFVVNTGPSSYQETPADFGPMLEACARRRLPMICANPDLEVMVGERIVLCAGSMARRYRELGGEVQYHGKPYGSVYQRCFDLLGITDRSRILAIGDTLHTDVAGGCAAGIDAALVTGGILLRQLGSAWGEPPSRDRLAGLLTAGQPQPRAVLPRFSW